MTLQEVLQEQDYDWIPDPAVENRIRIAGPDNRVAIIVEKDGSKLRCQLWRSRTGQWIEGVLLTVNQVDGLIDAIDELYAVREFLGDCPRCRTPMGLKDGRAVCPACGQNGNGEGERLTNVYSICIT